MSIAKFSVENLDFQFEDSDIVNPDDFIPGDESNPHNVHPWFLHNEGFCLAVVFADCLGDAVDIAADDEKLDYFKIDFTDDAGWAEWRDYGDTQESARENDQISFVGNNCNPYDLELLGAVELTNPQFSFVALFNNQTA